MASSDEASLIVLAQKGDTRAYGQLVRSYEQIAFRTAYLILRDDGDAADVTQDSFVRAYRALASFKTGEPFRPWLLRIVTNLSLNRLAARRARESMTERYARETALAADPPSPEHSLAQNERGRALVQALQSLSPAEKSLIALRYFLELPEAEVAEALNIPKGTVKSRVHRTLARLKDIIRRDYPDLMDLV